MSNNCLSVLYKHIIQMENKNVGLKVCVCGGGGGGAQTYHCPPIKNVGGGGGHMPPLPPASYASGNIGLHRPNISSRYATAHSRTDIHSKSEIVLKRNI